MKHFFKFISHLFVPSERNKYRARLLHIDSLTAYLVAVFVIAFVFKFTPVGSAGTVLGVATDINVQQLLDDTNKERRAHNLPEFRYNDKLTKAAQLKADDMFAHNYWAHYSPQGKTPWDFMLLADYKYEYAGENLAKNFMFSKQVVDGWMDSPTHRENILRREFTEVGFAIRDGMLNGEETTLVVQMFGAPLPAMFGGAPDPAPPLAGRVPVTEVLSGSSPQSAVPTLSLYATYGFIGLLAVAFFIDLVAIARLDMHRATGKNTAHLIFLIAMLIGITFFITKGVIL